MGAEKDMFGKELYNIREEEIQAEIIYEDFLIQSKPETFTKNYYNNLSERKDLKLEKKLTEEDLLGYSVKFVWCGSVPFDPTNEAIDVRLILRDGKQYTSNFVTRKFLDYVFDKNKKTGECVYGTYFAMPGMVVVDRIDEKVVRAIIEDMVKNRELENYFVSFSSD